MLETPRLTGHRAFLAALALLGLLAAVPGVATAAFFNTVPSPDLPDANPGDGICADTLGRCTVRAAIEESNALPGADTVVMLSQSHFLGGNPLVISSDVTVDTGAVNWDSSTTEVAFLVEATGEFTFRQGALLGGEIFVLPGGEARVIENSLISASPGHGINNHCGTVLVSDSTIRNSHFSGIRSFPVDAQQVACPLPFVIDTTVVRSEILNNGSPVNAAFSSGVRHRCGSLLVDETIVTGSDDLGGGFGDGILIFANNECVGGNPTVAVVSDSTIVNNADEGIQVSGPMPVSFTLTNTVVGGNPGTGVSIFDGVTASITGSLIQGNLNAGVKLRNQSSLTISNTTISGNVNTDVPGDPSSPPAGGMVVDDSDATLRNVTIVNNLATQAGGLFVDSDGSGSIFNSIVANNLDTTGNNPDCDTSFAFSSLGHNLIGDGTGCLLLGPNDQVGTGALPIEPLLCPLDDNGGPTLTHAPSTGSPVRDQGSPNAVGPTGCETNDQRGAPRPQDGDGVPGAICDIGAVEALPQENFDCAPEPPEISMFGIAVAPRGARLAIDTAGAIACLLSNEAGDRVIAINPMTPPLQEVSPSGPDTYTLTCADQSGVSSVAVDVNSCNFASAIAPAASSLDVVEQPESADIFAVDTLTGKIIRIERDSGAQAIVNPSAGCLVRDAATGIALDRRLNLYVVQSVAPTLVRIDPFTGRETDVSIAGAFLGAPTDVTVAASGDVFALEGGDGTIVKVDPVTLVQDAVLPASTIAVGRGIAARGDRLVVSDDDLVRQVDPDLGVVVGTLPPGGPTPFAAPVGLAVEDDGSVLVVDPVLLELQRVSETGSAVVSSNAVSPATPFVTPGFVAIDLNGQYLVADGSQILSVEPSAGLRGEVATGPYQFGGIAVLPPGAVETFDALPLQEDDSGVLIDTTVFYSLTEDGQAPAPSGQPANVVLTVSGPLAAGVRIDSVDENEFVVLSSVGGTVGADNLIMEARLPGEAEAGATGPFQDFFTDPVDLRGATFSVKARLAPGGGAGAGPSSDTEISVEVSDETGAGCETASMTLDSDFQNYSVELNEGNCGGAVVVDLSAIAELALRIANGSGGMASGTEVEVDDATILPAPEPSAGVVAIVALAVLTGVRLRESRSA